MKKVPNPVNTRLVQRFLVLIAPDKARLPFCRFLPAVVLTTSVLALAGPSAWAQNYAWDTSPGSANLNAGNWTSGTTPGSGLATPASGSSLYFGTSSQTSPVNNFASGFNIGGLTFNSGASAYTMSGSVAENLTGNITNSSTSLETINFPFALTASSTFVPGGGLTLGGAISGSGSLTISGSGTLLLSAINTYSGGTTVNGGTLQIGGANDGNSRAGSGLLTVNTGSTVTVVAENPLGWDSGTTTPSVVINGGTFNSGIYDFSAYNWTLTNGTLTGSGAPGFGLYFNRTPAITSAGTSTISVPLISNQGITPAVTVSSGVLTISSPINGTGGLTLSGGGTLTLSATNTFSGGTTVNGGTLQIGGANDGYSRVGSGLLTVNAGATVAVIAENPLGYDSGTTTPSVVINGGTFNGGIYDFSAYNWTLTNGALTGSGSPGTGVYFNRTPAITSAGTSTISVPKISNQGFTPAISVSSGVLTLGSLVTGTGGLTLTGSGTLMLTNESTYTGSTLVNGGILSLSGNNVIDYSTGIIGSSAITVANGTVLQLNGSDVLGYSSTSPLTVYGTVSKIYNQNETLNRPITLSGGMLTNTLSSSSSAYELFGNYIATAAGTTNWITGPGEFGLRTSSTYFTNAPGSVLDVSAAIVPYTGGCPLNKYGSGTMVLLATNTYNGATIVNGGTLALTGSASIANSSLISVTNGASLNVSGLGSTFTLASGQILSNSAASTGILNGNVNTGSGTVFVSYAAGTPAFTVTNGTLTLGNSTVFKVNNTGSVLTPGRYGLIGTANGSAVAGTLPSVTVTGGGITAGTMASLAVSGSQLNLVVSTVPTTNTLVLLTGSNPSTYGNSLTFQVTLSPAPTNGETVTFYDGVTALGSGPLTSGVATYITSALAAGPHSITAGYGGDSLYAGSTSGVLPQSVNSTALTITANNTNETYVYGMPAFTGGNGVTYAGFVNGETNSVLGGILSYGGTAQGVTNAGIYTIVPSGLTNAVNTNYTIGYANGALTISQATPVIGLGSSLNPAGYLAGISFSAALPADATGSVIFSSTNGPISTNTLSGGAAGSTSITNLARGVQVVTAVYSGDGNYLPGTNTFNQTITNHPPVAALMVATRTAGFPLEIALSDLATNWTDADGDSVELSAINLTSTNGVTLYPMNLATNLDGSYVITNNAYLGYLPTADVADQISYSISDGQGGTNIGYINIVVVSSVTGTNSITSITGGNPNGLTAYGIPGFTYITERSTNLTDWVEISTNMAATNGLINAADSFSDLGGNAPAEAFYRLLWQP